MEMHTLMMVAGGLWRWLFFALAAVGIGRTARAGARWFIVPWLAASLLNLYLGTLHGYTVAGELPFFAIVFGLPALAAVGAMRWKP
jgi:hypothetical protein